MNIPRKKLNQRLELCRDFLREIHHFLNQPSYWKPTKEDFMNIPLGFLDEASIKEVSDLSIQDLKALATRLKEAIETQDRRKKVLNEAMRLRFENTAKAILSQEGKDTGTVRFLEENTTVVVKPPFFVPTYSREFCEEVHTSMESYALTKSVDVSRYILFCNFLSLDELLLMKKSSLHLTTLFLMFH
jgi:hypothetical protein